MVAPGVQLGHYRLVEKLGEGGMGVVWRAQDLTLGREVALKVLAEAVLHDPDRLARLEREARALAALTHPNIVTIHSIEEADGVHFLTMEFVRGKLLGSLVPRTGMELGQILDLAIPLASALAAAHEKGIVHRDLKPANVMVAGGGLVKVLDFGLAKVRAVGAPAGLDEPTAMATEAGSILGTCGYMSPEQVQGLGVDARSDIFSFGCVLYEMATGARPFAGPTQAKVTSSILRDAPVPLSRLRPDLPDGLGRVVRRCLEKDPSRRYQTALDVRNELEDIRSETTAAAMPAVEPARPATGAATRGPVAGHGRRLRVVVALAAMVIVLAIAAALMPWRRLFGPAPSAHIRSIAVLPLANQMGDAGQDYFVDGLHDALITELARLGTVKVISRTSVMRYRKPDKPLQQIARELDVDGILEGSVLKIGQAIRVNAQLIDGRTEGHLWASAYDGDLGNAMGLLREVTHGIAEQISLTLTAEQQKRLQSGRPVNTEAQDYYLRGRKELNDFTYESLPRAAPLFQKAVDIDPDYAPPYAGLAICEAVPVIVGSVFPRDAAARVAAAANRAIALDNGLGEAHIALAFVKLLEWDWTAGIRESRRALELSPSNWLAYRIMSEHQIVMGDTNGAVETMRRGRLVDPLAYVLETGVLTRLFLARRFEEAVTGGRQFLAKYRGSSYEFFAHEALGPTLWVLGQRDEALVHFRLRWKDDTAMVKAIDEGAARGGAVGGLAAAADLMARRAEAKKATGAYNPYRIAEIYGLVGNVDATMRWLETAYVDHALLLPQLRADASFDCVHNDPRFRALVARLNLP